MDNGVVADSLDGLGASQFRHGVGVSPLLIKLPVGDLSFSWAWPLDPGPGDTKIGVSARQHRPAVLGIRSPPPVCRGRVRERSTPCENAAFADPSR